MDFSQRERNAEHTAEMLGQAISKLPDNIRPHVVAVVTDTPSVNRSAAKRLQEQFPTITWIPCLTLVFKDTMEFPTPKALFERVKTVAHFFYSRARPRRLLKECLEQVDLKIRGVIRVCELRFENCYSVMQRLLMCQDCVRSVVASVPYTKWTKTLGAKDTEAAEHVRL
jgi:hypothetical protein